MQAMVRPFVLLACAIGASVLGQNAATFEHGAVAADHRLASQAGAEILRAGGNAVDAAVATSFALSVVRPFSCGIGGGGFMVIALQNDPKHGTLRTALNYREQAPACMTSDYYTTLARMPGAKSDLSTHGGTGVAIPGTVAGLLTALDKYGTMTRDQVLAPAIRAADEGFATDEAYMASVRDDVLPWLKKGDHRDDRFKFLWTRFLGAGSVRLADTIRLPEQANALRMIAKHGAPAFYEGEIAHAIVNAVSTDGGQLTLADLKSFRVSESIPLVSSFREFQMLTMPPPSSGGIVLAQVFGVMERRWSEFKEWTPNSTDSIHFLAEAAKHSFADRSRCLGDPDFVEVPILELLNPAMLDRRAASITLDGVLNAQDYGIPRGVPPQPAREDHGTSHLCVVDRWGSAVACTETINLAFGSLLAVEPYGFILNDQMDDFTTDPGKPNAFGLMQGEMNAIAPGKRPLSSMTPTIVLRQVGGERAVHAVVGGSGGPRIISGSFQALVNVLIFDMESSKALSSPRFHHQWMPEKLLLEKVFFQTDLVANLRAREHAVESTGGVGAIQLIRRSRLGQGWDAACDTRKGGVPAGH